MSDGGEMGEISGKRGGEIKGRKEESQRNGGISDKRCTRSLLRGNQSTNETITLKVKSKFKFNAERERSSL